MTLITFLINAITQKDTFEGLGIQFGVVGFRDVNITNAPKGFWREWKQEGNCMRGPGRASGS